MDLLEYYHNTGKCPHWAYYQLNGKTAQENYNAIGARRHAYFQELLNQERLEALVEKEVADRLEDTVADTLEDIFAGFGK